MRSPAQYRLLGNSHISIDDHFAALQIDWSSEGGNGHRLTQSSLTPRISSRTIIPRFKVTPSPKERQYHTTNSGFASIGATAQTGTRCQARCAKTQIPHRVYKHGAESHHYRNADSSFSPLPGRREQLAIAHMKCRLPRPSPSADAWLQTVDGYRAHTALKSSGGQHKPHP